MIENRSDTYSSRDTLLNASQLLTRFGVPGGVHIDISCGDSEFADALGAAGIKYLGFSSDDFELVKLNRNGHEAVGLDLSNLEEASLAIRTALGNRTLGSISLVDTLARVTNGLEILAMLRQLAAEHGPVPLILTLPNIAHFDVAAKLLYGQWDHTEAGILDPKHIVQRTDRLLTELAAAVGWIQVDSHDVVKTMSEQHFPAAHPALNPRTSIGQILRQQRLTADGTGLVDQFVRVYLPGTPEKSADQPSDQELDDRPFATVVLRTQGTRENLLRDAFLCLAAQTEQDFELLVIGHDLSAEGRLSVERAIADHGPLFERKIRIIPVDGGERSHPLNVAVGLACGRYLVFFDDDDLVFANWVEEFKLLAARNDGKLLRTIAVEQSIRTSTWNRSEPGFYTVGAVRAVFPERFNIFEHLVMNHSPFMSVAFPIGFFHSLGNEFDETLSVVEDWDCILRAALICGFASAPVVTAIYHKWITGDSSYSLETIQRWEMTERQVVNKIDKMAHVFPPGTIVQLRERSNQLAESERIRKEQRRQIRELQRELRAIRTSRGWRLTGPMRAAGRVAKSQARGRAPR